MLAVSKTSARSIETAIAVVTRPKSHASFAPSYSKSTCSFTSYESASVVGFKFQYLSCASTTLFAASPSVPSLNFSVNTPNTAPSNPSSFISSFKSGISAFAASPSSMTTRSPTPSSSSSPYVPRTLDVISLARTPRVSISPSSTPESSTAARSASTSSRTRGISAAPYPNSATRATATAFGVAASRARATRDAARSRVPSARASTPFRGNKRRRETVCPVTAHRRRATGTARRLGVI